VLDVTDKGFVVRDMVPGITVGDLQALGDAELPSCTKSDEPLFRHTGEGRYPYFHRDSG